MLLEKVDFRFRERLKITLLIFPVLFGISGGLINGMWLLFSSPHLFWNFIDRVAFLFFSIFFYACVAAIVSFIFSLIPAKLFLNYKTLDRCRLISFYISLFFTASMAIFIIMQKISFSVFHLHIVRNLTIIGIALISSIFVTMLLYNILKKSNIIAKFDYFILLLFKKKSFVTTTICLLIFVVLNFLINEVFYPNKFHFSSKANIILISLDTLAAKHMGCYSYYRNTTPNIDKFADEGVLFEKSISQSKWTLPSHMSILTSTYPSVHGVISPENVLDSSFVTLAEVLKSNGYYCGAFVDVTRKGHVGAAHGFDQGFDFYEHYPERFNKYEKLLMISHSLNFIQQFLHARLIPFKHSNKITTETLSWLTHYKKKQPFFLFLHYYDIHSEAYTKLPYVSPPLFMNMYYPDYNGNFTGCGKNGKCGTEHLSEIANKHRWGIEPIVEDDLKYIISLYDGGISYVDYCIGLLLKGLDKLELNNNTIVIITADHGEEFLEHGLFFHGQYYDEIIRVPLIMRFPKILPGNKRVEHSVRSIDILPTILDLIGSKIDKQFQGKSLLPFVFESDNQLKSMICFGGLDKSLKESVPIRFVRSDSFKLITKTNSDSDIVKELYNLQLDAAELNNIIKTETKVREKLDKYLLSWDEECKKLRKSKVYADKVKLIKIDEKTKKELKALGYIK